MKPALPVASSSSLPTDNRICPNCEARWAGPRPRFCPDCGQETQLKPPTLRELAQQFGGAYLSTEGALWRTLKLLLLQPGELTRRYLAGRRKHYVLPLRLFLSMSVVMLVLMRLAGTLNFAELESDAAASALPERPRSIELSLGVGSAGLREGVFFCDGLPGWLCGRLKRHLDVDTRTIVREMHRINDRVAGNAGAMLFALMPVFAFGLWLLYFNRRLHYTEHLVFTLHLHAFWSLLLAVMMIDVEAVTWVGLVMIPLYGLIAMRHVYGGRWWPLLLRATALGSVHAVLLVVATVCVTLATLLLGATE
jgi:hypothetical protein